jgi:hypothetical protein
LLNDTQKTPDLGRPRSVAEVLDAALRLYTRYPVLFVGLSMAVVVPYWLVVLAVTNASPLGRGNASTGTLLTLALVDFGLVGPLVSALQVRAVLMIHERERPRFLEVVRRSMTVLPVVAAADIIAGFGIGFGLVLLVVPGIYLAVRWAVVAQVAAVEGTDWPGALRRSAELVRGNYLHTLAILATVALASAVLLELGGLVIGTRTSPGEVVAGIAIAVLTSSFQALTIAVLYFDLRAREASS